MNFQISYIDKNIFFFSYRILFIKCASICTNHMCQNNERVNCHNVDSYNEKLHYQIRTFTCLRNLQNNSHICENRRSSKVHTYLHWSVINKIFFLSCSHNNVLDFKVLNSIGKKKFVALQSFVKQFLCKHLYKVVLPNVDLF